MNGMAMALSKRRLNAMNLMPRRYVPGGGAYYVDEKPCPEHPDQRIAVAVSDEYDPEKCYKCGWHPLDHKTKVRNMRIRSLKQIRKAI
jgi:hypothetical protein